MRLILLSTMLAVSSVLAAGETAPQPQLPTLGSLAEVLSMTSVEAAKHYPFHLRAQVTLNVPAAWCLFLQDGKNGIYVVRPSWDIGAKGDWIETEGVTTHGGFAPNLERHKAKIVGHGPMPVPVKPRDPSNKSPSQRIYGQRRTGESRYTSVNFDLRLESGSIISVMIAKSKGCDLSLLVDADVAMHECWAG